MMGVFFLFWFFKRVIMIVYRFCWRINLILINEVMMGEMYYVLLFWKDIGILWSYFLVMGLM